uniref:Nudix hydrolase 27ic-like n=1 Tax=Rhizophora mucronata TaxID=61149 RepID=A0A2P2J8Q9_RHIMU
MCRHPTGWLMISLLKLEIELIVGGAQIIKVKHRNGFFLSLLERRKRSTFWVMDLKTQNSKIGHGCYLNVYWNLLWIIRSLCMNK